MSPAAFLKKCFALTTTSIGVIVLCTGCASESHQLSIIDGGTSVAVNKKTTEPAGHPTLPAPEATISPRITETKSAQAKFKKIYERYNREQTQLTTETQKNKIAQQSVFEPHSALIERYHQTHTRSDLKQVQEAENDCLEQDHYAGYKQPLRAVLDKKTKNRSAKLNANVRDFFYTHPITVPTTARAGLKQTKGHNERLAASSRYLLKTTAKRFNSSRRLTTTIPVHSCIPRLALLAQNVAHYNSPDKVVRKTQFNQMIANAARKHQVDEKLVHAVIQTESAYNADATSSAGAVGLMQLMPDTAKRYGVTDRNDPDQNINAGTRYLRHLLDLFNYNLDLAVAAYNAGEHAVMRHNNAVPPYPETRNYVRQVLSLYNK